MDDSDSGVTIPLRLQTLDLLGLDPPSSQARTAERLLATVYGLSQIVLSGMPPLHDKGRVDALIAALLRDATLSVAACLVTTRQGLYEPAMRVSRGVLEARLYAERIRTAEDPEQTANLLAIDRLLARKRNLDDQVTAKLQSPNDPFIKKHLTEISAALQDDALQRARPEFDRLRKAGEHWHGFKNLRQLAEHLQDAGSYHLVYAPASAFFVHPGDPDVHLVACGDEVELLPLSCADAQKLGSVQIMTALEAHRLLAVATKPWQLGKEIKVAIQQLLPLMLLAAARPDLTGEGFEQIESQSGIPRSSWHDLVSVTFDWPGPVTSGADGPKVGGG